MKYGMALCTMFVYFLHLNDYVLVCALYVI